MKLSYLVTCSSETDTLRRLYLTLSSTIDTEDEIIVLCDNSHVSPETGEIINSMRANWKGKVPIVFGHPLNNDYGSHKNYGNRQCRGDWIFQIDGDECPTETLLLNIKSIIQENPKTELYFVPRINDYIGVTESHAKQWGWRLTPCEACDNRPVVNWPDYQGRVYKNDPVRIQWDRRLHEKIVGHAAYSLIPADTDLALYHYKTIQKQLETNYKYNQLFSEEENRGHRVTT